MELPNEQVVSIMLDAYRPCSNFGTCREAQWNPKRGQVPRGFLGATGCPAEVELVMVFAEPGHPHRCERYDHRLDPRSLLRSAMQHTYCCYRSSTDPFHRNVRWFMSEVFPDLPFDEQLRRVWLTEGRLCSIDNEIGQTIDRTCASRYLVRQIKQFPNATGVAFGGKAQKYLRGIKIDFIGAYALAPPGANRKRARPTWEAAIQKIRAKRGGAR